MAQSARRPHSILHGRWRETLARVMWHAHPARPGPEYAFLRESQWWPPKEITEFQARQLRSLVEAAGRVQFYRDRFAEAGVKPDDIRTIADIARLPILERSHVERLGVTGLKVPGSWGVRAATSGSLGKPVQFLWPLSHMRWLDASEERARAWLGSEVGSWRLEVRCRPVKLPQRISAALLNATALHAPSMADPLVTRRVLRSLEQRQPTLVWGVSNALYIVAVALLEQGRRAPAKACWSGGNLLHPHYRSALEEAFQCRVYERYATMETGLIAHECPEGGSLHVPAEGLVAEIVRPDGSPAAPGETGDVLLTPLRNHATPLIRYRVGDRATVPDTEPCSCGRGLPLFGTVTGRTRDFLRTRSGSNVGPRQAVEALQPVMDRIIDFQVVQDAQARLRILVVQRNTQAMEADREVIASIFEGLVQPPERPRVERVDQIALTPGGKLRTLIVHSEP
jgi:phenylacetate-CoA ligase